MDKELPFCECGKCGMRVTKKGNRFIQGHNWRGKSHTSKTKKKMSEERSGVPKSPEHIDAIKNGIRNSDAAKAKNEAQKGVSLSPEHTAAISAGTLGVPKSPEHNAAVSKANKESDAVKAEANRQRGGFDIVKHHHIYDHSDLSKYTIEMTRQKHTSLHRQIQDLNIQVPHINTGCENAEELELIEYIKKIETTKRFIFNHTTRR